jgi:hypothetical protein
MNQRKARKKGTLPDERVQALDSISFVWIGPKGESFTRVCDAAESAVPSCLLFERLVSVPRAGRPCLRACTIRCEPCWRVCPSVSTRARVRVCACLRVCVWLELSACEGLICRV